MNDEDLKWLLQELAITAERARDRDITTAEFLVGLRAYSERLKEDYSQTV